MTDCADLWVFADSAGFYYAVHGCVQTSEDSSPWCAAASDDLRPIACPPKYQRSPVFPACTDGLFSYDDIQVYGCISNLNLGSSLEAVDLTQDPQILANSFPQCSSQNSLIDCPLPLDISKLNSTARKPVADEPIPSATSSSAILKSPTPIVTHSSKALDVDFNSSTATPGPVPSNHASSLKNEKAVVDSTSVGEQPVSNGLSTTIIVVIAVTAFALLAIAGILVWFAMVRRRRRVQVAASENDGDLHSKLFMTLDREDHASPLPLNIKTSGSIADSAVTVSTKFDKNNCMGKKFEALFDYTASQPDELEVVAGDILLVQKIFDDGWCNGVNVSRGGQTGMFPSNLLDDQGEDRY